MYIFIYIFIFCNLYMCIYFTVLFTVYKCHCVNMLCSPLAEENKVSTCIYLFKNRQFAFLPSGYSYYTLRLLLNVRMLFGVLNVCMGHFAMATFNLTLSVLFATFRLKKPINLQVNYKHNVVWTCFQVIVPVNKLTIAT